MKRFLTILLLFVGIAASAKKPDVKALDVATAGFNKALTDRDTVMLKELLRDELQYGHSNGWVQTKRELMDDLYNGKLTYKAINAKEETRIIEKNIAAVRSWAEVECVMDGKPLTVKLKVLQIWVWKHGKWEMFARQSAKI